MIRLLLAIVAGRIVRAASRMLGRGGSALPGLVAEAIDPRTIEKLVASLSRGVVVVTGTNGKTTTTRMLAAALQAGGSTVITNRTGSNLARGIASALIEGAGWRPRVETDYAVFEVDEAAVRTLAPRLLPRMMVVTNLARDQLDRFGELDTTTSHIAAAMEHLGSVVVNADDPRVAALASGEAAAFGAVDEIRALMPADRDLYGEGTLPARHLPLAAELRAVRAAADGQEVVMAVDGEEHRFHLKVPGVYNGYNACAAILAAARLGVPVATATAALEAMDPPFGRGQVVEFRGRLVVLLLVKNPAGFNQVIRLLIDAAQPTSVLFAINDNHADGRDVSWLWDARLEDLAHSGHLFGAGGMRAADMALRLKYAGIEAWAETDFREALDRAVTSAEPGSTVYVVPTYTALLTLLDLLHPGVGRRKAWS